MTGLEVALLWVTAIGTVLAAVVPCLPFFVELRGRKAAEAALAAERRDRAEEELLTEVRRVIVSGQWTSHRVVTIEGVDYTELDSAVSVRNQSRDSVTKVVIMGRRQDGTNLFFEEYHPFAHRVSHHPRTAPLPQ
ncbi:hypothetical protein OCAE111667_05305 [Occultella aeris]|uniref:Uncharacterized protein n=1 Tax=Occultella aeris TaxID=2761496 RepID=A0A7M4DM52_9MICO|nr:hypothetical protein [Occultella aeris]VZO38384.1 hypothetical protein HALOF300_03220 [Occultella aeris]